MLVLLAQRDDGGQEHGVAASGCSGPSEGSWWNFDFEPSGCIIYQSRKAWKRWREFSDIVDYRRVAGIPNPYKRYILMQGSAGRRVATCDHGLFRMPLGVKTSSERDWNAAVVLWC